MIFEQFLFKSKQKGKVFFETLFKNIFPLPFLTQSEYFVFTFHPFITGKNDADPFSVKQARKLEREYMKKWINQARANLNMELTDFGIDDVIDDGEDDDVRITRL